MLNKFPLLLSLLILTIEKLALEILLELKCMCNSCVTRET